MLNLKALGDGRCPGTFNSICTQVLSSAHVLWWDGWHQLGSQRVKLAPDSTCSMPFPFSCFFFSFWGIPGFDPRLGIGIPVHDASEAIYLIIALHVCGTCLSHLAVACLTLSRAVWGRPQSVLIFWWVPALVPPSLVPLGSPFSSILFFSPLSRFFLMCTQIWVLSSRIMALVLNGPPNLLPVSSSRWLWSSPSIVKSFLVLLVSFVEVTLASYCHYTSKSICLLPISPQRKSWWWWKRSQDLSWR